MDCIEALTPEQQRLVEDALGVLEAALRRDDAPVLRCTHTCGCGSPRGRTKCSPCCTSTPSTG